MQQTTTKESIKSSHYSQAQYWNDRFTKSEGKFFDWYVGWNQIKPQIKSIINEEDQNKRTNVLMVGCGNSLLSEKMYNDNFKNILNIDISDVVINQMRQHYKELCPGMQFQTLDALNMDSIKDSSFGITIDKGTFDAIACSYDQEKLVSLVSEMLRVTDNDNGHVFIVSNGTPQKRMKFYERMCRAYEERFQGVNVQLNCQKIGLSEESQMINLLRSTKGNEKFLRYELLNMQLNKLKSSQQCDKLSLFLLKAKIKIAEKQIAQDMSESEQSIYFQKCRQNFAFLYSFKLTKEEAEVVVQDNE